MPTIDQDAGVTLPGPLKTRWSYKADNPDTSTGQMKKREFTDDVFRWNPRLRVDEFTEFAPGTVLSTTTGWQDRTTGTPTTHAIQANTANGIYQGVLANTNEVETVGVDWADQLLVPATKRFNMQALVQIPTALGANQNLVVGMGTAYNSTFTSISKYVRFRLNGSMAATYESKDGTTTVTAGALNRGGITLNAGQWYLFTIDATKLGLVRYFIDDNMYFSQGIGAFAVTDLLQPMVYLNKASGTSIPSILIDWIRVEWNRF